MVNRCCFQGATSLTDECTLFQRLKQVNLLKEESNLIFPESETSFENSRSFLFHQCLRERRYLCRSLTGNTDFNEVNWSKVNHFPAASTFGSSRLQLSV